MTLEEGELPKGIRETWCDLHSALQTVKPVGPQNCVQATVQKMSSADATRHAMAIFSMHLVVEGREERAEPLRVNEPLQFAERAIAAAPRYLEKQG